MPVQPRGGWKSRRGRCPAAIRFGRVGGLLIVPSVEMEGPSGACWCLLLGLLLLVGLPPNLYAVAIRRGKQYTARGHSLCDGNPVVSITYGISRSSEAAAWISENISTCRTGAPCNTICEYMYLCTDVVAFAALWWVNTCATHQI